MLQAKVGEPYVGPQGKPVVQLKCGHLSYYQASDRGSHRWCFICAEAIAKDLKQQRKKGNKFNAKTVTVDGHRFQSAKEANRYRHLELLQRAGEIRDLKPHPRFELYGWSPGGPVMIGHFTADSEYYTRDGQRIIEDVKAKDKKGKPLTRTTAYQLRKKLVKANHGIEISEY